MIGDLSKKENISMYQPSQEVIDLTKLVHKAYSQGHEILHRSWTELNNYSVIDRMNKDQLTFNSFVDESVDDPRDAWKWKGTRGQARKNTMAMHAQITAQYILPSVFAQNESQELDREMSDMAHDVMEWMAINSNYRSSFLMATMGMLVNPVTYLGAEYNEVFQKVKCKNDDGSMTTKEILDEVLSGYQAPVYSADQILITNAYEQNIQRQTWVLKRRFVEYSEAEAEYSKHDNFTFVQKGIKALYSEADGLFYDIKDEENPHLVEEVTAYCRRDDLEVVYINGIYMSDKDVNANAFSHRDNRNAPKVPITPFGYERIGEHFYFYKSLINNVGWDHTLLDQMYGITMNKEILDLLPPMVFKGVDSVDTEVVMPGVMIASASPDFEATPMLPRTGNQGGYNAMQTIQASIDDGSVSSLTRGQLPDPNQKAYSVATANQQAQIMLSAVGKSLGESVMQYGMLMLDIALNHLTVAQIDELTGKPQYRTFILEDQAIDGKRVDKKLIFDEALIGRRMSKKQREEMAVKEYEKSMAKDGYEYLYRINPHLWSKMRYMTRIEPDAMIPKNSEFEKALSQQMYTLLRQDPLIAPEVLVRKLITTHYRGEENEFMPARIMDAMKEQQMAGATPEQEEPGVEVGLKVPQPMAV
jgi:hypothetical protein